MTNEEAKEHLRNTLKQIQEEKAQEKSRGGLISDPARQLAKQLAELEERITIIESQIKQLAELTVRYK